MDVEYDPEADALYITVAEAVVDTTRAFGLWRNVDYASDGSVVGVEILDPGSQGLDLGGLPHADAIARAIHAAGLKFPMRV